MRCAALVLAVAACGGPAAPGPPVLPRPAVPRLLAPPLLDPDAPAAAYLTAVALALQPAWHQFLEDCRLRLPASHALNRMTLVAIADVEVDRRGYVVDVRRATSGNAELDRAARQVIADASPLPPPPRAVWSDDDHLHLAWTFARDRRQAGPATAHVVRVALPLRGVVDRRIAEHDLARAARRIVGEPAGADRDAATRHLMIAALREGLASSDLGVRRAAVLAVGRAGISELGADVRALVTSTDVELAVTVVTQGFVPEAALPGLVDRAFDDSPRLALAALAALAARDPAAAAELVRRRLARGHITDPALLDALATVPLPDAARALTGAVAHGRPGVRAGACRALGGYPAAVAWPAIARGLVDRDASVRASCLTAVGEQAGRGRITAADPAPPDSAATRRATQAARARIRSLVRDRDAAVRAQALGALAVIDPAALPDASDDRSADVRVAFAKALASRTLADAEPQLRALTNDRDPDVRAAAWTVLAAAAGSEQAGHAGLAAHAMSDSAPQVRLAAVPAVADGELLLRLANRDESAAVRTAALVRVAQLQTRPAIADLLLGRLAEAPPGSAERVRSALAWLVAR